MTNYIDGFVLPIPRNQLDTYKEVVEKVATIWKENGALQYAEFVSDDIDLEGTRPFAAVANADENEVVIFGWAAFESREVRDIANKRVAADPRMAELVKPLTATSPPIFDANRMLYGGFRSLV